MINSISSLPSLPSSLPLTAAGSNQPDAAQGSFKNYLLDSIQQVNAMQQDADSAVEKLMTGGNVNPAEVLTAVQKADLAFKMMLQVRNKLQTAYEEIQAIRV